LLAGFLRCDNVELERASQFAAEHADPAGLLGILRSLRVLRLVVKSILSELT